MYSHGENNMRWIRLDVGFDDTEWVFSLSAESQLAWIKLLCYVKRDGTNGRVKSMSMMVAAKRWGVGAEHIEKMLFAAKQDGALVIDGEQWIVAGWDEYQNPDPTNAERQKRYREARNGSNALLTDNLPLPVARTETPTETETSKPNGLERTPAKRFIPPTVEEATDYLKSLGLPESEGVAFHDYHESKGWKVGTAPMKCWKAACRTWRNRFNERKPDGRETARYSY